MKLLKSHTYKTDSIVLLLILFCALFTIACSELPIFYEIEQEVTLKKSSVTGNVYALIDFNNVLYAANGNLHKKENFTQEGSWQEISKPTGVQRCTALATNGTTLYTAQNDTDLVYASSDALTWTKVSGIEGTIQTLFDNGTHVFVSTEEKLYTLNASVASQTASAPGKLFASAQVGGKTYFAERDSKKLYEGTTSIKEFPDNISALLSDGTYLYVAAGKKLYSSVDTWTASVDVSQNILSLAYQNTPINRILVGSSDGLKVYAVDSGVLKNKIDFGGNTDSFFSVKKVMMLFTIPNSAVVYAGVIDTYPPNNGLVAYFPSTDSWNRE